MGERGKVYFGLSAVIPMGFVPVQIMVQDFLELACQAAPFYLHRRCLVQQHQKLPPGRLPETSLRGRGFCPLILRKAPDPTMGLFESASAILPVQT